MERNIAVVGAGYWGKNLVRDFYKLGTLHTICDIDKELANKYKSEFQEVEITDSFDSVLANPSVTAVVIATPAKYHYQMAKEALCHNKHVFVEKPLALQVEQGEELVDLANKHGLVLMVGHILRYHPAIKKLKELISGGELGKILYVYSNRLNIGKIRSEENILWSFAPHDISVILFLLNEQPESVYATGGNYLQKHIPDVTLTTMDFKSEVKAHIFVSWLHPFKEQKLVVVGDKKMAVFDDMSEEKLFLYPHKIEWIERVPVACKAEAEAVLISTEEPLKIECEHFLDCIRNNKVPETDGNEGVRVLRVLQTSQESLSNNGVKLALKRTSKTSKIQRPGTQEFFLHESSYVDEECSIGTGTQIWHFSHVLKGSQIGDNCKIGQNVVIGPKAIIGNGCKIQNNVSIYEGVTLEDEVFCGPSTVFTNVFNPRSAIPRIKELRPTLIKKGATIGANATIVCGNTIGRYSFIGAGAVITKDVPDHALVVGNPGQISGWMCKCGVKIDFDRQGVGKCKTCSKIYEIIDESNVRHKK